MAKTVKNKYPADKSGTRYSEFRNTKRVPPGKVRADKEPRQGGGGQGESGKR